MSNQLLESDVNEIAESLGPLAHEFAGKRILLTGARGFLGKYFSAVFLRLNSTVLRNPCEVIALDNFITAGGNGTVLNDRNFAFVKHDVIKPFHPERKVDFILHAAGVASPAHYRKYPLETLKVATIGLENSLEIAKQHHAKILFFSSSEIYGDPDTGHVPTKESYRGNVSCLGPRACYDESKRLGETLTRIYHEQYQVYGTIVRPFNVYGPGLTRNDYRVLPNFAARISDGKPLEVYGTGRQTRTFCYATDAIRGFLQVLVNGVPGEPYNIGNPDPEVSMVELADRVSAVTSAKVEHQLSDYPDTYPADEPMRRCPDITKAKEQLGYSPTVGLDEGLKRFFGWAREAFV